MTSFPQRRARHRIFCLREFISVPVLLIFLIKESLGPTGHGLGVSDVSFLNPSLETPPPLHSPQAHFEDALLILVSLATPARNP